TGVCDDKQTCAFHGADVTCKALACSASAAETFACNGKGMCVVAETRACYPYGCAAPAGCRTVCAGNSDCAAPAECFSGTCGGLLGSYFATTDFSGPAFTRIDPRIDFPWYLNAPAPGLPADGFSVRWTGSVKARFNEIHTFHMVSDDGVRLWVDGQLIIDDFRSHGTLEVTGTVSLRPNKVVPIKLEYFDGGSEAVARLYWSSASLPKQVVPTTALAP
ncbi:MAG TPA: PA14 domain-containing protein, partial [Polyangia bacterium]